MADVTGTPSPKGPAASQAAVVSCWLCGIRLPQDQMMADGGRSPSAKLWHSAASPCPSGWARFTPSAREPD